MTVISTYCGQESLRRNGVAIMVNKRVWNAVLGCNLKNDRMISVRFQGKPFNITLIQIYAPTINAEEAEVERFYEDLQPLRTNTQKRCPFHYRGLECKCRKLRNTCLFTLLIFSFVVQKLLILMRSHLLIFALFPEFWGVDHRGSCCDLCRSVLPLFSS